MTTYALIPCARSKRVMRCTAYLMYEPSALFRGAYGVAMAR